MLSNDSPEMPQDLDCMLFDATVSDRQAAPIQLCQVDGCWAASLHRLKKLQHLLQAVQAGAWLSLVSELAAVAAATLLGCPDGYTLETPYTASPPNRMPEGSNNGATPWYACSRLVAGI